MRGFPNQLNTNQDVLNLLEIYPEETKAYLAELVKSAKGWIDPVLLDEEESGIEDETHAIRIDEDGARYQMTWAYDTGSKLARLGFTIEEAEVIING